MYERLDRRISIYFNLLSRNPGTELLHHVKTLRYLKWKVLKYLEKQSLVFILSISPAFFLHNI